MQDLNKLLNKIQQELVAPKNQFNKFGNYKYRSAEDILDAVKKLLGDAVLLINDDIICVGDRYYVKATVTLKLGDNEISATAFARESLNKKGMDDSQITGAASSYARKYALNGLFCIDDTKDADTMDNSKKEQKKDVVEKITPAQLKKVQTLHTTKGRSTQATKEAYKIESMKDLTKAQAIKLIERMEQFPDAILQ